MKSFYKLVNKDGTIINSPLLKNNGFGEGLFAMSLLSSSSCKPYFPQPLPQLLPVLPGYLYFFFYLYFSSSFSYSFFFPFFLFYFSLVLFSFSFFFLSIFFFFLSSLLPFLLYLFLVALLEGARKGIVNSYQDFY
jgi:hypothetical protein